MALTYPTDLAKLGEHWADAVGMDEPKAIRYAQAAEAQIGALPPTITPLDASNGSYVLAVALQARELSNASIRDGGVIMGDGGQLVRPRDLLPTVYALVRPRSVSFKVG